MEERKRVREAPSELNEYKERALMKSRILRRRPEQLESKKGAL